MKKYLILFFVAAAAAFQSCNNNDDLWDAIDDLKSRVQALETQVDALNNNVEAMKALYNGGATISEVSETDGTYTLKLTNGTTLTLTQGSEAEAVIPVVSIDAQGNWQYSVDGGKSFIALNVNAEAEDGVTPQFRVDEATGLWQINTTGEESGWTNVKNTAGEDVSAVGGTVTDKFFDSVRTDGNVLYVKLLGSETELQIPIVADVLCEIVTTTEGIQMFDSGVERTFDVKMKGIDQAIVVAPEGWTARLTDPVEDVAKLYVKAPGALASAGTTATRATANSSQDVAILAMFGRYSCISKIQVQSTGIEAEPPVVSSVTPSATVLPTDVTLTFDVQVANADGWKYICQRSDAGSAPDAAKVFADGTTVLGSSVTVEGLEAQTEYTIYVVACIGEQYSEVATAAASTVADPNDYYASGVEINGIRYDKDSEGAVLYTASEAVSSLAGDKETKVYFLDGTEANNTFTNPSTIYLSDQSIFVGRNKLKKTKLQIGGRLDMQNRNAIFGFKNLEIDMTQGLDGNCYMGLTGQAGVGGAKVLVFEDCDITIGADKNLLRTFSNSPSDGYIEQIIFRNCKIKIDCNKGTGSTYALFQIVGAHLPTGITGFKEIVFENNVLYAPDQVKPISLFYHNWLEGESFTSDLAIRFENNSLGNVLGYTSSKPGHALFILGGCADVAFSKNLIYSTQKQNPNAIIILNADGYPSSVTSAANDNRYYNTNTTSSYAYKLFSTATGSIVAAPLPEGFTNVTIYRTDDLIDNVDLQSGVIIPTSEHAAYGSSLR